MKLQIYVVAKESDDWMSSVRPHQAASTQRVATLILLLNLTILASQKGFLIAI